MYLQDYGPGVELLRRDVQDEYRFCLYRLEVIRQEAKESKRIERVTTRMRMLRETFPLYLAELVQRVCPGA